MSMVMQWGAPIQIDGKRPDWLRDDDRFTCGCHTEGAAYWAGSQYWPNIASIRLPVGHPYYLATSKGYTYWPGGDAAPADADLMDGALMRHGIELPGDVSDCRWDNDSSPGDIIGYRKIASPSGAIDQLRKEAEAVRQQACLTGDFNPSGFSARVSRVVGHLMKENERLKWERERVRNVACRAIDQRDELTTQLDTLHTKLAAMQEAIVEAVRRAEGYGVGEGSLAGFITESLHKHLPTPEPADPLAEAWNAVWQGDYGMEKGLADLLAALSARGLEVRKIGEGA